MKLILLVATVLNYFCTTHGINGGEIAEKDDFKYIVSIEIVYKNVVKSRPDGSASPLAPLSPSSSSSSFHQDCVGGIIHEDFILTTAHCFGNKGKINSVNSVEQGHYFQFKSTKATIYAYTSNPWQESNTEIVRKGTKVHFIKEFFETSLDDIAILELNYGLHLNTQNRNVLHQLTLPSSVQSEDSKIGQYKSYDNTICLIAGFGKDNRADQNNGSLKKMYAQIIPCLENCYCDKNKYLISKAVTKDGNYPSLPVGVCDGDSGAPVVLAESPLTIIGMVASNSNKRCDSRNEKFSEEYVRVTNYMDFIEDVISSRANKPEYVSYKLVCHKQSQIKKLKV